MKPVYIINGFLESGKTQFINFTLGQPYFRVKGKTLVILCEEGEEEYDSQVLAKTNTVVEVVDDQEAFTTTNLVELEKKHKPERIIIEYNGMWNFKDMKLPWYWKVEQQITIINGATFPTYYNNMKSMLMEMVRKSEMIIFNRCDGIKELNVYNRNIKAVNPKAAIIFEDAKGEIQEIFEEDLPYNLNDPIINLDDEGYALFYLDAMDHLERYEGKTITFIANVLRPDSMEKGYFVPGRTAMNCCAEDMVFLGYACKYDGAESLKQKEWVKVTAVVKKEYWADYKGEGPVLHAVSVEKTKAPKNEILNMA